MASQGRRFGIFDGLGNPVQVAARPVTLVEELETSRARIRALCNTREHAFHLLE